MSSRKLKQFSDPRNLAVYVFVIVVIAIAWSGVKTLQSNYDLQKQISVLQQQNTVLNLQNQTIALQNKYFQTNDYLDLAARQDLGLAAPGEKVLLITPAVALKYVDPSTIKKPQPPQADNRPGYVKNIEAWRDFLLGRKAQD